MHYSRFEKLIIGVGAVSIFGSLALSMQTGGPGMVEFVAQVLLFGVLVAAVHWGRRGGMVAALFASLIYIALRIPLLSAGLTTADMLFIITRIAAFGLVGIVGGEVCSRIKYVLARVGDTNTIDDWSHVYNQRYAFHAIEQARARYTRYGEAFSLVIVKLSPSLTAELRPKRQRTLVRAVANYLRDDVRMVDEVCRIDDGRFIVLLPHTAKPGGAVVESRLLTGVRKTVGAKDESVTTVCYGASEDTLALGELNASLAAPDTDHRSASVEDPAE